MASPAAGRRLCLPQQPEQVPLQADVQLRGGRPQEPAGLEAAVHLGHEEGGHPAGPGLLAVRPGSSAVGIPPSSSAMRQHMPHLPLRGTHSPAPAPACSSHIPKPPTACGRRAGDLLGGRHPAAADKVACAHRAHQAAAGHLPPRALPVHPPAPHGGGPLPLLLLLLPAGPPAWRGRPVLPGPAQGVGASLQEMPFTAGREGR